MTINSTSRTREYTCWEMWHLLYCGYFSDLSSKGTKDPWLRIFLVLFFCHICLFVCMHVSVCIYVCIIYAFHYYIIETLQKTMFFTLRDGVEYLWGTVRFLLIHKYNIELNPLKRNCYKHGRWYLWHILCLLREMQHKENCFLKHMTAYSFVL